MTAARKAVWSSTLDEYAASMAEVESAKAALDDVRRHARDALTEDERADTFADEITGVNDIIALARKAPIPREE